MDRSYTNEAQKDLASFHPEQLLKTNSILEKQAGIIYRAAFEMFQMELIEALHQYAVKVQDGSYTKYYVERDGDPRTRHTVVYNIAENKAWCDCCRFSFSGVPCRHVLAVFISADVAMLPEPCITKRWTKKAKTGRSLWGVVSKMKSATQILRLRFIEICHADSVSKMKCAEKELYQQVPSESRRKFCAKPLGKSGN